MTSLVRKEEKLHSASVTCSLKFRKLLTTLIIDPYALFKHYALQERSYDLTD